MGKVLVIVFCVAAAILAVRGDEIDRNINDMLKGTSRMLRKYDENLDRSVPFKELKESMKVLEKMTQTYNGSSRQAIYKACELGRQASNNYFRATDTIFGWCVKADRLIDSLIKPSKSYSPKAQYKILLRTLETGMTAIDGSYGILEKVRDDMSSMSGYLEPVPQDLRDELENLKKDLKGNRRRRGIVDWFSKNYKIFVIAIQEVVKVMLPWVSTVLKYLNLLSTFLEEGLPRAVIDGKREGTVDENLKMVTIYYTKLIDAVVQVQGNVTNVQDALQKEMAMVNDLRGKVESDLDTLNITEVLFDKEELNNLKDTLNDFISRHNADSDSHNIVRRELRSTHGMDFDQISYTVDAYMNATALEREAQFWRIPNLPANPGLMINEYQY